MSDHMSLAEGIGKAVSWMRVGEELPMRRFVKLVELIRGQDDDGAIYARLAPVSKPAHPDNFGLEVCVRPWIEGPPRRVVRRVR